MATKKTIVRALMAFAHGNVVGHTGGIYAMNPGDAKELEKAGFVSLDATGEPEQTQIDHPAQPKKAGDVVVDDDTDDVLGEKMAAPVQNKMDNAPTKNKSNLTTKKD